MKFRAVFLYIIRGGIVNFIYKKAGIEDLDMLVKTRIEILKVIAIFLIVMYLWYLVLKENNRYLRRKKYIMKILENKTNK